MLRIQSLMLLAAMLLVADCSAAEAIRSGDGWAIHTQAVPEDWTRLVAGGNLIAAKLVRPQPGPNDHNTGSELKHLTDGGLAGADGRMWSDKRAMGWAYQPYARLTFDLEKSQPVGQVVMRLQVISQTSTLPGKITVSLSDDGEEYSPVLVLSVKTKPDDDPLQLTDGKSCERIDEAIWFERGCVGWQGPPLATIFADLGAVQPIDSVVMRLLGGAVQNALEFPDEIKVLLSDDGQRYFEAAARHKRGPDDLSADA